jgi:hypothetical protein
MVLFMILVLPAQAARSSAEIDSEFSPDTSFFYTADQLYEAVGDYGEEGRKVYIRTRWTFDLIYPLVYMSFLTIGISWFSRYLTIHHRVWSYANLIPIAGTFLDYLENITTSLVMGVYPTRILGIAYLAGFFTLSKWFLIVISFLIYFVFGVGAFIFWIRKKRRAD